LFESARGDQSTVDDRTIPPMRILIVDTCYPAFLDSHYAQRPTLVDASYDVQWRALMDRFFGTCDSYSHFLGELDHQAHEVVVNCEPLQRAWAQEHGVGFKKRRHLLSAPPLVLQQAEEFRPDVVYMQDLNALNPGDLRALRARSRLLVGQIASEPPPDKQLAPFDLLLTSLPHFVPMFLAKGFASEYFRIGFDPRVLSCVETNAPTEDVVFVGTLARTQHGRGNDLLERAARRAPIEFWGRNLDGWPAEAAIRRSYRGEAWGLDMYRILAASKIALNRHIDVAEDHANNMRLYEATGVGTLLITDAKRNLGELFEPDEEVVTYASEDELVEKIRHYLANDPERSRIARAGQERTLRDHTYAHRMRELVAILGRFLS
jgi:spore maturation protein CgeB